MIAVLKSTTTDEKLQDFTNWLKAQGLDVHISRGETHTVVGLIGNTEKIDIELIEGLEIVDTVKRISRSAKNERAKAHLNQRAMAASNTSAKTMTVGIYGLGLIGGSMARAYRAAGHRVLGYDRDSVTEGYALLADIINEELNDENIAECDVVFVALYPKAAIECIKRIAPLVNKNAVVIDLCGTKKLVCEAGFAEAESHGFTFVGGHPMAGKQFSGIKYASTTLFRGAPMVLVPPVYDDIAFIDRIKELLAPVGFGQLSVTTAEAHDSMIAFTSQLAHVVSNAYVKSPSAEGHKGFSAGSYKDLTRVAWLNEYMWTELFLENKEPLIFELDYIIKSLSEYRSAIAEEDAERLRTLLREGREAKERIDG